MNADDVDKLTNRIIEFLNYGNLYGARAFLGFLISAYEADGALQGGDTTDWRAMYESEVKAGIVPALGPKDAGT
jgi:hypothetical protein